MPRKKFEEIPYNPIAADLMRDVAATGRMAAPPPSPVFAPVASPSPASNVLTLMQAEEQIVGELPNGFPQALQV